VSLTTQFTLVVLALLVVLLGVCPGLLLDPLQAALSAVR
jgi:NADH:ubiquinone oxidoreductase subunit 4 (subunit M)